MLKQIFKMSYSVSNIEREYGDSNENHINLFMRPVKNEVIEDYETLDETIDRKLKFFENYDFDFISALFDYQISSEEEKENQEKYRKEILSFLFDRDDVTKEVYEKELKHLKLNKQKFERSNLEGHFTGSAWIMTDDGEKALLTLHKKLGKLLQLGGHCDGDTNVLRCAIKEAMEESGITTIAFINKIFDIDVHVIPEFIKIDKDGNRTVIPEHKHYDIRFLFTVPSDSVPIVNEDESNGLIWITKDHDINSVVTDKENKPFKTSYGVTRMISKWKNFDLDSEYFILLDMEQEF